MLASAGETTNRFKCEFSLVYCKYLKLGLLTLYSLAKSDLWILLCPMTDDLNHPRGMNEGLMKGITFIVTCLLKLWTLSDMPRRHATPVKPE